MGNVFKDSTAPYVLVLLLSLVGWMFNSAIENASKLRVIQYRVENGVEGNVPTKTLYLANRSMTGAVSAGRFVLTCVLPDPQKPCLAKLPRADVEAQFLMIGKVVLASNPQMVSDISVGFPALIPPRGEVGYRIGVTDPNAGVHLVYNVDYDPVENKQSDLEIVLVEDKAIDWSNWDDISEHVLSFVLGNYITLLFCGIAALSGMIGLWLVGQFIRYFLASISPKTKEKAVFKVTTGGATHEIVVEEV